MTPRNRLHALPAPSHAASRIEPATLPTPYEEALASGELTRLLDTPINRLIQAAAVDAGQRGVVDELGALRIVLTRLVNEVEDLDLLTANVTRVVSVALQAARTQRLIGEGTMEMIAGPLHLIIDEIRADRSGKALNPDRSKP